MDYRDFNKIEKKLINGKELTKFDINTLVKTIKTQKQVIDTLESIIREGRHITRNP